MKIGYLSLLAPIKQSLIKAAILQTIATIAGVVPFICIVVIMDELLATPIAKEQLLITLLIAVAALIIRTLCGFTAGNITHFADNNLQLHLRQQLSEHLQQMELGWFSEQNSGTIKKILQDDILTMHHLVAHTLLEIITAFFVPFITIIYLFYINIPITLLALLPLLAGAFLYWLQIKLFTTNAAKYHQHLSNINRSAIELLDGIEVIKVFSASEEKQQRFSTIAKQFVSDFWTWCNRVMRISATSEVLLSPALILFWNCFITAVFISQYHLTSVNAVAFILLGTNLAGSFYTLISSIPTFQASLSAAQRVYDILQLPTQSQPLSPQHPVNNDVHFEHVTFAYENTSELILNDINLTLKTGTITAIIGPSGSGKSTLARLLLRYADPIEGKITIGNVDLRNMDNKTLFSHVGFVFQEIQLLRASIADNIALGHPEATYEEISQAAKEAQIEEKILSLPDGYQTIIEDGLTLSGGEAQRIAIARALLADKKILVLDEPTAFADASSERAIQQALSRLSQHKTVLIITHNLRSIMNVDNIVVLIQGKIVGQGTHKELLENCSEYYQMWQTTESATSAAIKGDKHE